MLLVFALVAGAGAGGVAHAQENPKKARELFQQGKTFFDLGQFDDAIKAWQDGYRYKADPLFLYNIAQAYRQSGNPQRALFFYKSYLTNFPRAPNRAEVEEKIEALQKVIDDAARTQKMPPPGVMRPEHGGKTPPEDGGGETTSTRPATTTPRSTTTTPPTTSTTTQTPPQTTTTAMNTPPPPPGGSGASTEPPTVTKTAPPTIANPIDIGVMLGMDVWATGIPRGADPSFALAVTGGYTLQALSGAAFDFRVGGKLGFSFLSDVGSTDVFLSVLADPMVRIHLMPEKLDLYADLGLGVLILSGLTRNSALLKPGVTDVTGALAAFELRPAVGVEYYLSPSLSLQASPGLVISPPPNDFFAESIVRFELAFGASLRL